MVILIIVGIIVGLMCSELLVRYLFHNFVVSRILSAACCVYLLIQNLVTPADERSGLLYILVSVFAWLFLCGGALVFDRRETGWVKVYGFLDEEKEYEGGFWAHFWASAAFMAIIYWLIAPSFKILYWIVPIVILILVIITWFRGREDWKLWNEGKDRFGFED